MYLYKYLPENLFDEKVFMLIDRSILTRYSKLTLGVNQSLVILHYSDDPLVIFLNVKIQSIQFYNLLIYVTLLPPPYKLSTKNIYIV